MQVIPSLAEAVKLVKAQLVESVSGRLRMLKSLLSLLVVGQSIILIATCLGYDPPADPARELGVVL